MADQNINKDQQLSTMFDTYLERDIELDSIQDPLISVLMLYKEERFEPLIESGKEDVWARIDRQIARPATIHGIGRTFNFKAWAVAATVLIASFIGLYTIFLEQSPVVLLQTYAEADEIILEDGSRIILRPYSTLTELKYTGNEQEYSLNGEGFFNIAKKTDREVKITAGNGRVIVLGTRFNLSNWGGQSEVYLEEGSVRFESTVTASGVNLEPGESAQTIGRGAVILSEEADAREYNDWRENQLIFSNKELGAILAELEQHFNIVIRIPDDIRTLTLSGGLALNSPEQSLEYLALTLDGDFEMITEREYRFITINE